MRIADAVAEQFTRTWHVLRAQIDLFPEEKWRRGIDDYLIPSRLAYHLIEAAEFFSGETPDGFAWGARFGVDWEGARPDQLPTRTQTLGYLDEVEGRVDEWLQSMDDSVMLSGHPFPWTGDTVLQRAMYLLRHNQHHIAELNLELRRRGLPSADWR